MRRLNVATAATIGSIVVASSASPRIWKSTSAECPSGEIWPAFSGSSGERTFVTASATRRWRRRPRRGDEGRVVARQRLALDQHGLAGGLLELLVEDRGDPTRFAQAALACSSCSCRSDDGRRRRRRTRASRRSRSSGGARSSGPCGREVGRWLDGLRLPRPGAAAAPPARSGSRGSSWRLLSWELAQPRAPPGGRKVTSLPLRGPGFWCPGVRSPSGAARVAHEAAAPVAGRAWSASGSPARQRRSTRRPRRRERAAGRPAAGGRRTERRARRAPSVPSPLPHA